MGFEGPDVAMPEEDYSDVFTTDEWWPDRESVIAWARTQARQEGMILTITRSWKSSNTRKYGMVHLACEQYGSKRELEDKILDDNDQAIKKRDCSSKKSNCTFMLHCYEEEKNKWRLKVHNGIHNHELNKHFEGHAYAGRLSTAQYSDVVDLTLAGCGPKPTVEILRARYDENTTSRQQVYNARAKFQRSKLGGVMTPMQVLLKMLSVGKYVYSWRTTSEEKLQDIAFANPTSLLLWKKFPCVMIMDTTYNTNT